MEPMRIVNQQVYNGAQEKIQRLGLTGLWNELLEILTRHDLRVKEEKDANGGAAVREQFDSEFRTSNGWSIQKTGGIDWTKCHIVNGTRVCIGVEIQFSGRSDLLIIDVTHLRDEIISGHIDIGVIAVPSDHLALFLTDRCPSFSAAVTAITRARAQDMPLIILGLEHDGPGSALPKRRTRQGRSIP